MHIGCMSNINHVEIERRDDMREYSKVYPQIWIGKTGRELKKRGIESQLLAQYLISSPHATMIGVYYLPIAFISHETGIAICNVELALNNLIEIKFCSYDWPTEYVWVHRMGFYQIAELLKPNDNRVKNVNSYFANLPPLCFLDDFFKTYSKAFNLEARYSSEESSKPLQSQEQEKEQEHEQEKEKELNIFAESKSDSALIPSAPGFFSSTFIEKNDNQIKTVSNILKMPLKNNKEFTVTANMIANWQNIFPTINVNNVLANIKEWNEVNPKRRKGEEGILRHINLWLAREQDKQNESSKKQQGHANALFNHNQNVADDWLQSDSGKVTGDFH